ncbi:unnamed protein product [Amoebophrya sp. A120]|nr:unnamed protein product [Amoebophrya sp. A120]|eukprot:GSA120T00004016001.1
MMSWLFSSSSSEEKNPKPENPNPSEEHQKIAPVKPVSPVVPMTQYGYLAPPALPLSATGRPAPPQPQIYFARHRRRTTPQFATRYSRNPAKRATLANSTEQTRSPRGPDGRLHFEKNIDNDAEPKRGAEVEDELEPSYDRNPGGGKNADRIRMQNLQDLVAYTENKKPLEFYSTISAAQYSQAPEVRGGIKPLDLDILGHVVPDTSVTGGSGSMKQRRTKNFPREAAAGAAASLSPERGAVADLGPGRATSLTNYGATDIFSKRNQNEDQDGTRSPVADSSVSPTRSSPPVSFSGRGVASPKSYRGLNFTGRESAFAESHQDTRISSRGQNDNESSSRTGTTGWDRSLQDQIRRLNARHGEEPSNTAAAAADQLQREFSPFRPPQRGAYHPPSLSLPYPRTAFAQNNRNAQNPEFSFSFNSARSSGGSRSARTTSQQNSTRVVDPSFYCVDSFTAVTTPATASSAVVSATSRLLGGFAGCDYQQPDTSGSLLFYSPNNRSGARDGSYSDYRAAKITAGPVDVHQPKYASNSLQFDFPMFSVPTPGASSCTNNLVTPVSAPARMPGTLPWSLPDSGFAGARPQVSNFVTQEPEQTPISAPARVTVPSSDLRFSRGVKAAAVAAKALQDEQQESLLLQFHSVDQGYEVQQSREGISSRGDHLVPEQKGRVLQDIASLSPSVCADKIQPRSPKPGSAKKLHAELLASLKNIAGAAEELDLLQSSVLTNLEREISFRHGSSALDDFLLHEDPSKLSPITAIPPDESATNEEFTPLTGGASAPAGAAGAAVASFNTYGPAPGAVLGEAAPAAPKVQGNEQAGPADLKDVRNEAAHRGTGNSRSIVDGNKRGAGRLELRGGDKGKQEDDPFATKQIIDAAELRARLREQSAASQASGVASGSAASPSTAQPVTHDPNKTELATQRGREDQSTILSTQIQSEPPTRIAEGGALQLQRRRGSEDQAQQEECRDVEEVQREIIQRKQQLISKAEEELRAIELLYEHLLHRQPSKPPSSQAAGEVASKPVSTNKGSEASTAFALKHETRNIKSDYTTDTAASTSPLIEEKHRAVSPLLAAIVDRMVKTRDEQGGSSASSSKVGNGSREKTGNLAHDFAFHLLQKRAEKIASLSPRGRVSGSSDGTKTKNKKPNPAAEQQASFAEWQRSWLEKREEKLQFLKELQHDETIHKHAGHGFYVTPQSERILAEKEDRIRTTVAEPATEQDMNAEPLEGYKSPVKDHAHVSAKYWAKRQHDVHSAKKVVGRLKTLRNNRKNNQNNLGSTAGRVLNLTEKEIRDEEKHPKYKAKDGGPINEALLRLAQPRKVEPGLQELEKHSEVELRARTAARKLLEKKTNVSDRVSELYQLGVQRVSSSSSGPDGPPGNKTAPTKSAQPAPSTSSSKMNLNSMKILQAVAARKKQAQEELLLQQSVLEAEVASKNRVPEIRNKTGVESSAASTTADRNPPSSREVPGPKDEGEASPSTVFEKTAEKMKGESGPSAAPHQQRGSEQKVKKLQDVPAGAVAVVVDASDAEGKPKSDASETASSRSSKGRKKLPTPRSIQAMARMHQVAEEWKRRREEKHLQAKLQREEELLKECTFAPTLHSKNSWKRAT